MKDTRPIEVQVAELTSAQKQQIKKIFRLNLIILIVSIALCVGFLANAYFKYAAWKDAENELDETYITSMFNFEEREEAREAYDAASQAFLDSLIPVMVVGFGMIILALILLIWQKKAHPYYSDKKYFYLRKNALL